MPGRILLNVCLLWLVSTLMPGGHGVVTVGAEMLVNPNAGVLQYEEPRWLTGAIYGQGPDNRKLLFKFQREATRSGKRLTVQRDYTYPDGKIAARERVIYDANELVAYELDELQIGAKGSAKIERESKNPAKDSIQFRYTNQSGERPKANTEALRDNTLINDMVGPFIAAHWDQILNGQKVKCRYVVVPRKETVGFTFAKDATSIWRDRGVIILKMEPSSPFISALVDPLYFTVEKDPPHRVLQYVGRTTPKVEAAGKWKDLDAVTVFDWKSAH